LCASKKHVVVHQRTTPCDPQGDSKGFVLGWSERFGLSYSIREKNEEKRSNNNKNKNNKNNNKNKQTNKQTNKQITTTTTTTKTTTTTTTTTTIIMLIIPSHLLHQLAYPKPETTRSNSQSTRLASSSSRSAAVATRGSRTHCTCLPIAARLARPVERT
jgi:hypothetical protein